VLGDITDGDRSAAVDDAKLLDSLAELAKRSVPAIVHFADGDVFELRVVTTMHSEEGGDFVAEVVRTFDRRRPETIPAGSFINCFLADVTRVTVQKICSFERATGA
jgi:hypothetical protein